MALTLELLNHMAANHPGDVALSEQESAISFMQLKSLVDTVSGELFDTGALAYGQHTENENSRTIIGLCAARASIQPLVTIPISVSNEGLSATLKAAHLQVLYTDLMDKLWETTNIFGPFISAVTPIELCHRKIWKVKFRSEQNGNHIDGEAAKFHYSQWLATMPAKPPLNQ